MATFYSDIATKQNDPKMGNRPDGIDVNGGVRAAVVTYTMVGTEATNDVINLVKLPAGASVIAEQITVSGNAPASTFAADIGDEDDPDRYVDGLGIASSGTYLATAAIGVAGLTPHKLTSDQWISLTGASIATPSAGKLITVVIPYRMQV